jgi:phospholipid-binding lipoprotein MlaA
MKPENMSIVVARTVIVLLCVALCACAGIATRGSDSDDPFEPLNRAVFDVNQTLDGVVIRPIAEVYRATVPKFIRDRIRSAIDNLAEPRIFVNDLLQGRINAGGMTFTRFLVNTIGGLGGMFDVASTHGFPRQTGDFGQTLHAWGVADGPYLVLLFFGPSNVRDAVGLGVDLTTTPPSLIVHGNVGLAINFTVGTIDGMDQRSRNIESLDEIKADALDFYSRMRSLWRQQRRVQLQDAREAKEEPEELLDPGTQNVSPP